MVKEILYGKTLEELQDVTSQLKMPKFTAKQIAEWLYKKNATSIDEMSNISKKNRSLLDHQYQIGLNNYIKVEVSKDGTKKYLFEVENIYAVETAMIPDKDRVTVCVSSQVGCKMGCKFCATGKQGFQKNLTVAEILNQLRSIDEYENITNIVYMGMGEPFDNMDNLLKSIEVMTSDWGYGWSPRRVTVSTVGVGDQIDRFMTECDAHLAVSIHTPSESFRSKIMPINNKFSITSVVDTISKYDFSGQRRVSFEYILFDKENDTDQDAMNLATILRNIQCRVNLIRYHENPESDMPGTNEVRLLHFKEKLNKLGVFTTIRTSRGEDISAACGLLSTKEKK